VNRRQLYQRVMKGAMALGGVSRHQRENIKRMSVGVVLSQKCQERQIARRLRGEPDSQRKRVQRYLKSELEWAAYTAAWTSWVVQQSKSQIIQLVVDETKLGQSIGVMLVGLVYKERCIPLAWRAYRANDSAAYPAEGQARMIIRLLKAIRAGVPAGHTVRVLADRGIGTSPRLMRGIMAMGWTFLFRVTKQSKIQDEDGDSYAFYDQVQQPGQSFTASGLVFKKRGHIPARAVVLWGCQARNPWALVTNDPTLTGWEYAHRAWIEPTFRDLKSHGWHWGQSGLDDPARVQMLLTLLAFAHALMVWLGYALEQAHHTFATRRRPDGSRVRRFSLFQEGLGAFTADLWPAGPPG
jgi:hypothetical protein